MTCFSKVQNLFAICHHQQQPFQIPPFFLAGSDGEEQWATGHQQRNCKGNEANLSEDSSVQRSSTSFYSQPNQRKHGAKSSTFQQHAPNFFLFN